MINLNGLISIVIFYIAILGVGIWIAKKKKIINNTEEKVILAENSIGLFFGIFKMTASWLGGGYINGTAEIIYTKGFVWCQAPFGYALSLIIGGIFFTNKMRQQGYTTMLDPLKDTFGKIMSSLLILPALIGQIFWVAGIISVLGSTISIAINIEQNYSIIFSAIIAVIYTLFGGFYHVAFTDVIQLACIFIGLWLCIPFAWMNNNVQPLNSLEIDWIGSIKPNEYWKYIDNGLLLIFGGIPWQIYFQNVLSSKTFVKGQLLTYIVAFCCIIMTIPSVIIGAIAKSTAWNETNYIDNNKTSMILPIVLKNLTPNVISLIGLGAVSASVMSSIDSNILSASLMFANNIYKLILREKASEVEIIWVIRIGICIVGIISTTMALSIQSIYELWSICCDLIYVILFPQLLMVINFKNYCNTYGSLSAYIIGVVIRLSGGDNIIGLPAYIHYPGYDKLNNIQLFPFKTMAMLISLLTLITISYWTNMIFLNGKLSPCYDIFNCVIINIPDNIQIVGFYSADNCEQMAVLAGGVGKLYGSKNKANGCVNKALEPDNDMKSDTIELISNYNHDDDDDVDDVDDQSNINKYSSCKKQLNTVF